MSAAPSAPYDPATVAKWWVRFNWDAEANRMADMSVMAAGLMFKLRAASWVRYGIPTEEEALKRILKFRCGIRLKRFRQLWLEIEHLFFEKDGFWFFIEDENERGKVVNINAKRKEAGQNGAKSRWSREPEQPSESMANAITDYNNNNSEERDREDSEPLPHLPVQVVEEEEVGSFSHSNETKNGQDGPNGKLNSTAKSENGTCHGVITENTQLNDEEYKQFCSHCADPSSHPDHKPFAVPGRKLAERIKIKFKMPISTLPKFSGQQSAAMWDSPTVTIQQVDLEIARLKNVSEHPERFKKPAGRKETDWDEIKAQMLARAGAAK